MTLEEQQEWLTKAAQACIPCSTMPVEEIEISNTTMNLTEQRDVAYEEGRFYEANGLTRKIKTQAETDTMKHLDATVARDLKDIEQWAGLKQLRKGYNPCPITWKHARGSWKHRGPASQSAAQHLYTHVWSNPLIPHNPLHGPWAKLLKIKPTFNTRRFTMRELRRVIRRFKRRKATGPGQVPMELYREMSENRLEDILAALNEWWEEGSIPEQMLLARVVLIFKKRGPRSPG